jgi:hypothetical protein
MSGKGMEGLLMGLSRDWVWRNRREGGWRRYLRVLDDVKYEVY